MYRKGVLGVVINKDKKFLILYRVLHWRGWEMPKGGVESESEEDALRREIKEETGLKARIICKLGYDIIYDYPPGFVKKMKTHYKGAKQSVYLVSAEGRVRLSAEHSRYKWASYREARRMLRHQNQKKALDAAYKCVL